MRKRSTIGQLEGIFLDVVDSAKRECEQSIKTIKRNPIIFGLFATTAALAITATGYLAQREIPEELYRQPTAKEMRENAEAQKHLILDTMEEPTAGARILYEIIKASKEKYGTRLPPTKAEYNALTEEITIDGKSMAQYQRDNGMVVGNDSFGKLAY